MPAIPAFCDTCGTAFPSGFFFENASNVTLSGNKSGPCPSCGGMGHVPDGVFNFIGNTIEILSAPQRTVNELTRLVQIIHEAKAKQQSKEQVAAQIKQELPGLSPLADLLPKNRGELYGFLGVVIAAITLLTQSPQPSQNITINVSQVVEQTLANPSTPKQKPSQSKKIGRNEPCPCGSEKNTRNAAALSNDTQPIHQRFRCLVLNYRFSDISRPGTGIFEATTGFAALIVALVFFLFLPVLLKHDMNFRFSLFVSSAATPLCCLALLPLFRRAGFAL